MNSSQKIALLAKQPLPVFHTRDLAHLWGINNANSLYTLLKRFAQQGLLYRIFKGYYSLQPIEKLDPLLLGIKALHGYAYVSTETVLARSGVITQIVHDITLVSSRSRSFQLAEHSYLSRQLKDEFLFNPVGIYEKDGIFIAGPERAAADLLYFNPRATFDGRALLDLDKMEDIQKEIGYIS